MASFIWYIVVGAVAGWLAGLITKGGGFGFFINLLVGIIGGVLGGWVFGLLGISSNGGIIGNLVTALVGAIVLLFILSLFRKKT